jgi:hypothetical protein
LNEIAMPGMNQSIAHGPGPPHRPHMPGAAPGALLADSAPTAKTLSVRAVLADPHLGHLTFASSFMVRCNCSKEWLQDLQAYS